MKTIFFLTAFVVSTFAQAADLPGIPAFIDEMVAKHRFKRDELVRTFKRAEHRPDVIEAITKPATMKPWAEYRATFINQQRIEGGIKFWKKYGNALKRAEKQFGVPQEY
ncbi:MAG: lytic murein transglycosylase, partial [Gallionella sp.]|nr:lytic murein transglycosylase [Gallionella sp.]